MKILDLMAFLRTSSKKEALASAEAAGASRAYDNVADFVQALGQEPAAPVPLPRSGQAEPVPQISAPSEHLRTKAPKTDAEHRQRISEPIAKLFCNSDCWHSAEEIVAVLKSQGIETDSKAVWRVLIETVNRGHMMRVGDRFHAPPPL